MFILYGIMLLWFLDTIYFCCSDFVLILLTAAVAGSGGWAAAADVDAATTIGTDTGPWMIDDPVCHMQLHPEEWYDSFCAQPTFKARGQTRVCSALFWISIHQIVCIRHWLLRDLSGLPLHFYEYVLHTKHNVQFGSSSPMVCNYSCFFSIRQD